jgi:hypothetical protein
MNFFNYIILEIFLEHNEVEEYEVMIETLKQYLDDFVHGRRNEKVVAYVNCAIRLFDKNLTTKKIYIEDIDSELYELLELAKLHI